MRGRLIGLALVVLVTSCRDDIDPREGSVESDEAVDVAIAEIPDAYRITYRVVDGDDTSTEVLTVDRPFDSRLATYDGDDAEGEPTSVSITTFGRFRTEGAGEPVALAVPPGVAPNDVRFDAVLDDAIDAELLVPREQRRVLERVCQVYRTGQSVRLGELVPPTDDSFVDVCVDEHGLVLEEVDGSRRRVAVEVAMEPDLAGDEFDVGQRRVPIDKGGGAVRHLSDDSRTPGRFLELGDDLPLARDGRYAVVPPQPDAFTDPMQRDRRIGSVTDVLRRDPDVVFVDRVGSLGQVDVIGEGEHGRAVDVGALGEGELVLTVLGPEITVALGSGQYVRVSGTLPADDLVAIARDLREVEGGELTPVDEPW